MNMKKIFLLGLMLMFGVNTGFSQNILGNMTMSATPPEGYTPPKKDSAKVKINATSQSQKTGRLYDDLEYSPKMQGKFTCVNQGDHIKQGDTFRIKCVFDPRSVFGVRVIKGYSGKQPIASPRNLMKGEWIAEVKPEKSTEVVLEIETPIKGMFTYSKFFVLVIEPDKYDEIHAKFEEFRKNKDAKGRQKYVEELGGEEYQKHLKRRSKPFNP
jgi:hypothetical protein